MDCYLRMDWKALLDGLSATDGLKSLDWLIVSYEMIERPWLMDCQQRMNWIAIIPWHRRIAWGSRAPDSFLRGPSIGDPIQKKATCLQQHVCISQSWAHATTVATMGHRYKGKTIATSHFTAKYFNWKLNIFCVAVPNFAKDVPCAIFLKLIINAKKN